MKKLMMTLALLASMVACASVDVYEFKSTMNVYSAKKEKYVSTPFNGTLTVDTDDGSIVLSAKKKDSGETFDMELDSGETPATTIITTNVVGGVETVTTNTIPGAEGGLIYAIVTGKKDAVGAIHFDKCVAENLTLALSGAGTVKVSKTKGCGPCGEVTTCIKISKLKGAYVGNYSGGCTPCGEVATHYNYDFTCELPEDKDVETCPVWGSWVATLKTVDGAKFK